MCAQRPKASERGNLSPRSTAPVTSTCAQRPKASERGNRGGEGGLGRARGCAQRPKASERGNQPRSRRVDRVHLVLNARRHRSGGIHGDLLWCHMVNACSTPEGIGAGESSSILSAFTRVSVCSTPEGIGAGESARGHGLRGRISVCSTPEGIGAGESTSHSGTAAAQVSAQRPKASERGNPLVRRQTMDHGSWCSTPEGIGAGESFFTILFSGFISRAQRPKASERGNLAAAEALVEMKHCAQRPKASERGNRRGPKAMQYPNVPTSISRTERRSPTVGSCPLLRSYNTP